MKLTLKCNAQRCNSLLENSESAGFLGPCGRGGTEGCTGVPPLTRYFVRLEMIQIFRPSFTIVGSLPPSQVPMTLSSMPVPKRCHESSRPLGKRSKMPKRRTKACVPISAVRLPINNARSLSSSSMQTLQYSLRGDPLLQNIISKYVGPVEISASSSLKQRATRANYRNAVVVRGRL
jgi:hypothetical protein